MLGDIELTSVGLTSAQGDLDTLRRARAVRVPEVLPWPRAGGPWASPLVHIDPCLPAELVGAARVNALARRALLDALGPGRPARRPDLVIASAGGGLADFGGASWERAFDTQALLAGTPWEQDGLPVVSSSCASGWHALFLATRLLAAGRADVVALAVDAVSPALHEALETLRRLGPETQPPWRPASRGVLDGEAAVALRLSATTTASGPASRAPFLTQDVDTAGLVRCLAPLRRDGTDLLMGQAQGPHPVDMRELRAVGQSFAASVPLSTVRQHFGHTHGASGLLGLALASLRVGGDEGLPCLRLPAQRASDGRPLGDPDRPVRRVIALGRALNGSCGAASLTRADDGRLLLGTPTVATRRRRAGALRLVGRWGPPAEPGPLGHPLLRRLAAEASAHRPRLPPALLVARLDLPLSPGPTARAGGRLLPSALLELSPGFVPQLLASVWGFGGAALALVGGRDGPVEGLIEACRETSGPVALVRIHGAGDARDLEWDHRA